VRPGHGRKIGCERLDKTRVWDVGLGWAAGMEFAGEEGSEVSVGLGDYKMQKDGQGILVGQASGCNLQSTGVYDLVGSKDVRSSTVVPLF
jgi:hypothetical protein